MLSNDATDVLRSQIANTRGSLGSASGRENAVMPASGVDYAKARLIELSKMLGELELHTEQQVNRLCGAVPMPDEATANDFYRDGAVGEMHNVIDGLFATVTRIAQHARRFEQV